MAPKGIKVYLGPSSMLTAYGLGTHTTIESMAAGRTALSRTTAPSPAGDAVFFAQAISDNDIEPDNSLTRLERMAATVVRDTLAKTTLPPDSPDLALVISSTKGNISALPHDGAQIPEEAYMTAMASRIAAHTGIRATPLVVCNACISGVAAAIAAARLIRDGQCRHALVVGADELTDFVTSGFLSFRSVSPNPCLPYDARRDGLSLGEAAACLLLTADESLSTGTCLEGGALTDDANHISGPSRTGEPLAQAIRAALSQTGLTPEDISMVNAHGTATVYNDEMESKAMGLAGLDRTPLNSLKPYLGHTLGASGLLELILCAEELKRAEALPTPGFRAPGTPVALSVSAKPQPTAGLRCLKTASGFGGCNAAAVIARQDVATGAQPPLHPRMTTLRTVRCRDARLETSDGLTIDRKGAPFADFIRDAYHQTCTPNMKFFKMDNMCRLGYVGAEILLDGIDHDPDTTALLLANHASSLDTDKAYLQMMLGGQPNPAKFVYTLPNIAIGEMCIRHSIRGETLFLVMDRHDPDSLRRQAASLLDLSRTRTLVAGWLDLLDEKYELYLEAIRIEQA